MHEDSHSRALRENEAARRKAEDRRIGAFADALEHEQLEFDFERVEDGQNPLGEFRRHADAGLDSLLADAGRREAEARARRGGQ